MSEKTDFGKVFENVKELHDINFGEDGLVQLEGYKSFTNDSEISVSNQKFFNQSGNRNGHYACETIGCCYLCENEGCHTPDGNKLKDEKKTEEYEDYKLCYVSHGSHSVDFLRASGLTDDGIKEEFEKNNWNTTPVVFLMENPSKDNKVDPFYGKVTIEEGIEKYPTNTWYWIHRKRNIIEQMQNDYESYLKQGYYGEMAYALICKYKLANAYLTNVIKCGMNPVINGEVSEKKPPYLGTWWYHNDCKTNCVKKVLSEEVKALTKNYDRLIVFAFGNNAYWLAKDFLSNTPEMENIKKQLVLLPHPSSRLNNTFRRILLTDYLTKAIDDENIGELNSKQNLVMIDDEKCFKKELESKIGCKIGCKFNDKQRSKKNNKQVLKVKKDTSLFSDKCKITEIIFKTTNSMQYGYCVDEQYFWAWDETEKKFIDEPEFENDDFFISFKNALKEKNII